MQFTVNQDQAHLDDYDCQDTAVSDMELAFAAHQEATADTPTTFTVKNAAGEVVACKTNRAITAAIHLQHWTGPKLDSLRPAGPPVKIDATAAILLADYETVVQTQDFSYCSDWLKEKSAVIHTGPYDVEVEENLCEFFGVDRVGALTRDAFEHVKSWYPKPTEQYQTLTVTVTLCVKADSTANLGDFVETLAVEVTNRTPGTCIEHSSVVSKVWA